MNLFLSNLLVKINTDKKLISTDQRKSAFHLCKSILIAVLTLGLFLTLGTTPALAATVSWDGGSSGSWNTGTNWSNDIVPTSSDDVTIDNAAVTTSSNISFSTLTIGSGTNTTSLTLTNNITSGGSITINNAGTLTQNNKVQQTITGTLTINSGGNLTHTSNTTTNTYNVNFSAGTITVNSSGTINVNGKGYTGGSTSGNGNGPGAGNFGSPWVGGGGAHGGIGGRGSLSGATGGSSNDSVTNPTDLGSGGGGSYQGSGGNGGGAILLTVSGTLTVGGSITANGSNYSASYAGGGSGGTINITVGTFTGTGTVTANGGNGQPSDGTSGGGGGSGGRIAINYTTDSSNLGTLSSYGGTGFTSSGVITGYGGPGTIYKATQAGASRTLIIDNNSVDSNNQGAELDNYSMGLDIIQLQNKGNLHIKSGSSMTVSANQVNPTGYGNSTGILSNDGTLTLPVAYTLDGYTLWANVTGTISGLTALTIGSTGTLSHGYNSSSKTNYINLSLTTLTVTGSINVNSKGYSAGSTSGNGNGPGAGNFGSPWVGGGGAHGGIGGRGSLSGATGGSSNDSVTNPTDLGSGGGGSYQGSGGNGGGTILLTVSGTLTVGGSITANGNNYSANYAGGGSGGTINLTVGTLAGTGSVTANGGNGFPSDGSNGGGGGGGGRIAISATTNNYTGNATITSGTGYVQSGMDGTVYFGSPTFSNVTVTANANASATVSGVKTIAFWVKPTASTAKMIQLATGVDISSTTGTLSSNGITNPTYYVNSIQGGLMITLGVWNHVVITTNQGITANSILLGQISSSYLSGQIDDVRLYTTEYSSGQVLTLYSDSNTLAKLTLASASEQAGPAPLVYWKFDEGTGTTTSDSSGNGITATLAGSTIPTWQTEDNCTSGKCLYLNGSSSKLTISSISPVSNIKSVGLWVKPTSVTSLALIDLDGGTHKITVASGVISATGFSSPTIFVNGKQTTTLTNSVWSYVEVTTTTGFTPTTALTLGNSAATYLTGYLDEVKLYDYTRSSNQVLTDYSGKKAPIGAAMIITPASYSSGQAPIGHWRLDENTGTTANDSSSATTPATGTISGASWKPGKYGASLNFDGTDDTVSVANESNFDFERTNSFSIGAWIKTSSSSRFEIFSKMANSSPYAGYEFQVNSGKPLLFLNNSGSLTNSLEVDSNSTVNDGNWHHILATYNGSSSASGVKLYIDGNQVATTTVFDTLSTSILNDINGQIGSRNNQTWYSSGSLDDIRIYNYTRTQKQVISDMMGDGARSPVRASSSSWSGAIGSRAGGPVAYYKFDEGYSTTANNSGSGGSALNGTLTGMASPATSTSGWTQAGKFNRGLNFDGTDDYINVADNDSLSPTNISISAWVYRTTSSVGYYTIAGKNHTEWEISLANNSCNGSAASFTVLAYMGGSVSASCGVATVPLNQWAHIVVTYDAANTRTYVNGLLDKTTANTNGIANGTNPFRVGVRASDASSPFVGTIDEVKIYPYALTAQEILTDYNHGSAQILGALSDNTSSSFTSSSSVQGADHEYCIPGDATSCAAPVGRWDFDENTGNTVNDKSGNNNTGTWNGTLGNQWKPGKFSPGGNFNGSNNDVTVANSTSTNITGNFTLSAWIKPTTITIDYGDIIDKAPINSGYFLIQRSGNIYTGFGNGSSWQSQTSTTSPISAANQWYFVSSTWDGTNIRTYVNGNLIQTTVLSGNPTANTRAVYIGQNGGGATYFNGQIDQVRVFNYARTPAQVAWDYNRGAPLGHWKFDECQGTSIKDSSGNSNTGTLTIGASGEDTVGTCTTSSTAWGSGVTGKRNYSLSVDGTDDYISVSDTANLRFDASTADFSLFAWVKRTTTGTEYIISKEDADNDGYRLQFNSSNLVLCSEDATDVTSTSAITDTSWHHVGCTIDRDGNGQVYIDGKADGSATSISADAMATTSSITLGTRSYTATSYLNGQIDDARIYNYALTALQVKLLYNQNSGIRFGPSTGAP